MSFVGEKKAVQTYDSMCKQAYKVGVRQKFAIGGGMAVFLSVVFCTYALALWYGSRLILKVRGFCYRSALLVQTHSGRFR